MRKNKISAILYSILLFVVPVVAAAQTVIENLFARNGILMTTFNIIIGLLFVLATIIFLWGVIQFIVKAGDEQARSKAKGIMTWGIVGLAVMAAAWGIVNILVSYVGLQGGGGGTIPRLPGQIRF